MPKRIQLSPAEALLVEIAHSDSQLGHQNVERIMQARLSTITNSHDIPDGTNVSFQKDGDKIFLLYELDAPDLKVMQGGADATSYDDYDETQDHS